MYTFPGLFISNNNICQITDVGHLNDIVEEHKLFNENDMNTIRDKISNLSNDHVIRNSVMTTVGIPSYIDGYDENNYNDLSQHYNEILSNNFDFVYPKLLDKLKTITGKECAYPLDKDENYRLSLPGYHIFKGDSWLGSGWSVASLHCDKQYLQIPIKKEYELDYDDVFSFTVGIDVPDNSGLYLYDFTDKDIEHSNASSLLPMPLRFKNKKLYKINYKPGYLYIHDGLHYHMISEFKSSDDRITLQGHGIWCKTEKRYWIYW